MKTAVIIASRDAELLDLCLRAHARFTPEGVDFIVVDTSEGNDEPAWHAGGGLPLRMQRLLTFNLRHHREPCTTYSQWNAVGARLAMERGADLLVFANDDTVVTPDWLPTMEADLDAIRAAGQSPGMLGACSNAISGPQACIGSGGRRKNGIFLARHPRDGLIRLPFHGPAPCAPVYSFFAAVPAAAYRACGGWDRDLPTHCGSDDVLSARLVAAGFSLWMSRAFVCHFGSETLRSQKVDMVAEAKAWTEYAHAKYPEAFDAEGKWVGGTGVKA